MDPVCRSWAADATIVVGERAHIALLAFPLGVPTLAGSRTRGVWNCHIIVARVASAWMDPVCRSWAADATIVVGERAHIALLAFPLGVPTLAGPRTRGVWNCHIIVARVASAWMDPVCRSWAADATIVVGERVHIAL